METQKLEAAEQAFTKLLASQTERGRLQKKTSLIEIRIGWFREFMADHMLEEEGGKMASSVATSLCARRLPNSQALY